MIRVMHIMSKKSILGMPPKYFYTVCAFLAIGIIIGSFCDFNISKTLSNQTAVGDFFQHYGNIVSHFMYPIAGICIFKGIRRKGKRFHLLSNGVLVFSLFWTFYSFLETGGKYLRKDYGYVAGESSAFPLALTCLTWLALIALVTFIAYKIIDDKEADRLIAIGSVILIAGMFSEYINEWLKAVGCRPRYRYLVTLDDPISEFKNWWEMTPYLKDESSFKSWPSGHMTKATIMFALPMLTTVLKNKKEWWKYVGFGFAVIWILLLGYNRIHMNAHFLTDVCFGVLITYSIYALTYRFVFSALSPVPVDTESAE